MLIISIKGARDNAPNTKWEYVVTLAEMEDMIFSSDDPSSSKHTELTFSEFMDTLTSLRGHNGARCNVPGTFLCK